MLAVSSQELREIAKRGGLARSKIEGGKAAVLVYEDIDFGLTRVFQAYSEIDDFPYEIRVFRDLDAARKWLIS